MSHGCAEWRGDLATYVVGALEEDESAAMRRHLAACPACRADYEDFLPVRDWLIQTKRHLAACRKCRADYEEFLGPVLPATAPLAGRRDGDRSAAAGHRRSPRDASANQSAGAGGAADDHDHADEERGEGEARRAEDGAGAGVRPGGRQNSCHVL